MKAIARRSTTAATIVVLSTSLRGNAICAAGTAGSAIHTGLVIWKVIWKLRLVWMAFS